MPVLVTGAEDALGLAVVDRLLRSGGEVRAYLDEEQTDDGRVERLRRAGSKVAVGGLDDEGHLEAALAQVHTVVHCWRGPWQRPDDVVAGAATVVSALLGAGVRRMVWVRELATSGENPYLAALDATADLVDDLPVETVTLATGMRHGPGDELTDRLRAGWLSGTAVDPSTPHAPVHVDDVAHAVEAADRQRATVAALHVRLALVGPETMPLRDVLGRLGAPPLDAAGSGSAAPPPVVDWLSRPAAGPSSQVPTVTVAHGRRRVGDDPQG